MNNNVNICSGCKIGAGAVVVRDITVPGTYVEIPARRINNDKDSNIGK
jgi:serine acetyltransferase